jgi:hypothetical protein
MGNPKVISLWVVRQERKRVAEESQLMWVCDCGSTSFHWYKLRGLVCNICDTMQIPWKGY